MRHWVVMCGLGPCHSTNNFQPYDFIMSCPCHNNPGTAIVYCFDGALLIVALNWVPRYAVQLSIQRSKACVCVPQSCLDT
jgi:hypothetical protein